MSLERMNDSEQIHILNEVSELRAENARLAEIIKELKKANEYIRQNSVNLSTVKMILEDNERLRLQAREVLK